MSAGERRTFFVVSVEERDHRLAVMILLSAPSWRT
jgi:hypothetical protein